MVPEGIHKRFRIIGVTKYTIKQLLRIITATLIVEMKIAIK